MRPKVSPPKGKSSNPPLGAGWSWQRIVLSNLVCLMVGMGLMGAGYYMRTAMLLSSENATTTDAPARTESKPAWGELEYLRFSLREPESYLPTANDRLPAARWFFPGSNADEIAAFFKSMPVPADIRGQLLDTRGWQSVPEGLWVSPSMALLRGLTPPARERLYSRLAQSPINFPQYYPFRFRQNGFKEWFAHSNLGREKLQLIQSLVYTNQGGAICLADLDVLQESFTAKEFHDFCGSLYSEPSLMLSLRIRPDANVETLAQYWGRGGRELEVMAMLKSVAQLPGGGSVNVAYLLPPFARVRLYTFAGTNLVSAVSHQDCFWTALNFFKVRSDPPLPVGMTSLEALMREYAETSESPRYGDVLVFWDDRTPVHACVFIADDVVFTKNGVNFRQPWVLTKLHDLLPRYTTDRSLKVVVLRPNHT